MQATQAAPRSESSFKFPTLSLVGSERSLIGMHILIALVALSIGVALGPFQTFRRAPALQWDMPIFSYYYQALTAHGVLNALVFTTYMIMAISYFVTQRSLERTLKSLKLAWLAFWLMTIGLALAGGAIIAGEASVLYTFYPPMQAHWAFYLGLALVIVGTWLGFLDIGLTYNAWRKDHPGEKVPLAVYGVITNGIMWFTASLGVAIEVLTMLLPMSLGIIDTTDPQVGRILFWFFGHPLVYFWLIPAYISWYTMLPKQLGVRLFSDTMGRLVFLMIMIFAIPIGVHHLYVDPGVSEVAKIFHSIFTFVVAIPSFLTAFNIAATMERGGRKRGAKSLLGWIWHQPWDNPVIVSQYGGMILFIFGGITGIMNASFNMNIALHNTAWVVGHFHTTVAGAVFMTYTSILYWLLPMVRGRKLFAPKLALAQAYLWLIGMFMFGATMGRAGLEGAVRRTDAGAPGAYVPPAAAPWLNWTAVAGMILGISAILLFIVVIGTVFFSKENLEAEPPIHTKAPTDEYASKLFENWKLWIAVVIISNVIMWGPVLWQAFDPVNGFWVLGVPGAAR